MVWKALSNRFHQGQVDLVRHMVLLYMHDLHNVMLRLLLACWLVACSHALRQSVNTSTLNPCAGIMLLATMHTLH